MSLAEWLDSLGNISPSKNEENHRNGESYCADRKLCTGNTSYASQKESDVSNIYTPLQWIVYTHMKAKAQYIYTTKYEFENPTVLKYNKILKYDKKSTP